MRKLFYLFLFFIIVESCDNYAKEPIIYKSKLAKGKRTYVKKFLISPAENNKKRWLDDLITKCYDKRQLNGTILIAQKGKILYKGAFGQIHFKDKTEATLNSAFQLASVSKIFTAIAVMMLEDKGKLKYDEDLKKYIPGFPYEGVTVRHLLNHRSGLQNYIYVSENFRDKNIDFNNSDIMNMFVANEIELEFKPGKRFKYCNTNYAILALLVEKVSKQPFDEFMKKNIFDPLGMKNSFIYNSKKLNNNITRATGYTRAGGKYSEEIPDNLDGIVGDKGVYSTVEDLYKFDRALYTYKLMKQSTLREAFFPNKDSKSKTKDYGFGWRIKYTDGRKLVYHYGWWRGFRTYYLKYFDDDITIISLNNRDNVRMNDVLIDIVDYLDTKK